MRYYKTVLSHSSNATLTLYHWEDTPTDEHLLSDNPMSAPKPHTFILAAILPSINHPSNTYTYHCIPTYFIFGRNWNLWCISAWVIDGYRHMSLCRANLTKVFADIVGTIPSVLVAFWYPNDALGTFRAGSGAANLDLEKVVRPNHLLLTTTMLICISYLLSLSQSTYLARYSVQNLGGACVVLVLLRVPTTVGLLLGA